MSRLVFLGSAKESGVCLEALVEAGHDVVLVVTAPDRKRGRGGAVSGTPAKDVAVSHGLSVAHELSAVAGCGAVLGVVVAFGALVPAGLLERLDFVNVHFSLLPRWRGAAPVERAILAGDATTGICLMKLEAGLDTGPVYASVETEIGSHETAEALRSRLAAMGARLLVERVSALPESLGEPRAQDESVPATYATKLDPRELRLEWSLPAEQLERVVRVGRAWTTFRGQRLLVREALAWPLGGQPAERPARPPGHLDGLRVRTGEGELELLTVQQEGRPRRPAAEWLRGARVADGERFG